MEYYGLRGGAVGGDEPGRTGGQESVYGSAVLGTPSKSLHRRGGEGGEEVYQGAAQGSAGNSNIVFDSTHPVTPLAPVDTFFW